jgi:hypothetical protein
VSTVSVTVCEEEERRRNELRTVYAPFGSVQVFHDPVSGRFLQF